MVISSLAARQDLEDILYGLVTWEKHPLEVTHAVSYIDDLTVEIDAICKQSFHLNCYYDQHKKYGEKVYRYKRNQNTHCHIIYDWDIFNRVVYINKIINNYLTTEIKGN